MAPVLIPPSSLSVHGTPGTAGRADPSLRRSPEMHVLPRNDRCSGCTLQQWCLPTNLALHDILRLESVIGRRRRVLRDDALFRMGDPFVNLYALRLGHFKTFQVSRGGAEQITGFPMTGELLGFDGLGSGLHHCYAVALEDSEVCEIPFQALEALCLEMPTLLRHCLELLSQELNRELSAMMLLGNMRAEQRFAAFLVNLSNRYHERGYSATHFYLRMSREDIGNYLGLTIESISRLLARFRKQQWLRVNGREIELLNMPAVRDLAAPSEITLH